MQFGVDVMENSRKEPHGCIVAQLKFCPPDQSIDEPKIDNTKPTTRALPANELYRLNTYLQEAAQREQILETKLMNLQKIVELTR